MFTINLENELVEQFMSPNHQAKDLVISDALLGLKLLEHLALFEVKGRFTEDEILLVASAFNGYYYSPVNPKHQLVSHVMDYIEDDDLDAPKWEIDKTVLCEKFESLSQFDAHAVISTVMECWDQGGHEENTLRVMLRKNFQG